ncbi:hypothetical protein LAZ67_10001844 [Cordylochernes scorpioides]|uniref:Transposase n=1 Tax=Cordylochernes scorpioides TaxID=51811 RepID=A0ABY6KW56_9ARAC|nr:hypothetical protein LAZ67_10001844 [Cordylochernes scorpioides]
MAKRFPSSTFSNSILKKRGARTPRGRTAERERPFPNTTWRKLFEKKIPEIPLKSVKLYHDNARPHTSFKTSGTIGQMGWSLVPQLPSSPDLAHIVTSIYSRQ